LTHLHLPFLFVPLGGFSFQPEFCECGGAVPASPALAVQALSIETDGKPQFHRRLTSTSRVDDEVSNLWSLRNASAARSPMTTQGAMVLPVVTRGMIEPSAMRRFSIP
jgi:hypothetical protein